MRAAIALLLLAATAARGIEPTAVVSLRDGAETFANPGCGMAGGGWSTLSPGMKTNGLDLCASVPNCTKLWSMQKFSKGYVYKDNLANYTNHVMRFVGGADIPLDENALLSVSNSLLNCRRNGGTCIPRFAYTWDQWGGVEPDDFDVLLTHIRQLSALLSQFRDVVPAIECGIIGAWGEMHTSRYAAREYQNRIVGAWLDGLPKDMALLARSSYVWMHYLDTESKAFFPDGLEALDPALRARMGFYNDGYLGTDWDYGTWGGGGRVWTRAQGRDFLRGQAVPYGGEFAYINTNYFDKNVHLLDTNRFNIVQEWYDTHLSYLRNIRCGDPHMGIPRRLSETPFSSAKWAFDGMPRLSEYDGVDLRKFCEDHMGYRYVVRGVHAANNVGPESQVLSPKSGRGVIELDLEIENTGFGQLLFDEAPEVLLVPQGGTTAAARSTPPSPFGASPLSEGGGTSINPPSERGGARSAEGSTPLRASAQMSATLASIRGGTTAHVTLTFPYPADAKPGQFDIWLRLRVPLVDEPADSTPRRAIRFANDGCWNPAIKANYLCTL